jgi:UDP-2-acetamido-3-amino-2,3-dideoxy-glucuronate N-acetyltransferase
MSNVNFQIHPSAVVDEGAVIGDGTTIWHFSHICSGAVIGKSCSLGQNVFVADNASIGNNVKVQNNVAIYGGITVEDDVFLGPSCVLTNVTNPRSQVNRKSLYEKTLIKRGATIGANATIVCGITLGRYCFVGAGTVVTKDVPDYGLVLGNPGKLFGYMSRHGHKLTFNELGMATCPESKFEYEKLNHQVSCLDLNEDEALPGELSFGSQDYDSFKSR